MQTDPRIHTLSTGAADLRAGPAANQPLAGAGRAHHAGTRLPQLRGGTYLTDGGLETTAIFHHGIELPHGAAFLLLRNADGREWLRSYYRRYLRIAHATGSGFVLETPTWRASSDWAWRLNVAYVELDALNARAVALMRELAAEYDPASARLVVSGCVGPRRDGYAPDLAMTAAQAETYHLRQLAVFARAGADLATAMTITNSAEAIGIARGARALGLPVVVSFTVETDGRLPTGQPLGEAIAEVDAATAAAPVYYMLNCAHPDHFAATLDAGGGWVRRLRGLRANASCRSHAELDQAPALDDGDPRQLGRQYRELLHRHPHINVLGGCCGTDHRHLECIASACTHPPLRRTMDRIA
ncbi:homocysteine S-methyltransferase family protein [Luteimonas sp. RD2P54]|uniref:Homocysteine S-methyltransferase family protein n=1 Tax=Luteimonas endophytica TaxID=3042023 RepID=A0ABT6J552_9GAMM|nr:homocysteine S-methyltransferase family protein [Luteimonas endophytica]MDH5821956.1 homocysteine S-methyltransferase family protein [Luteimonas endophytica]